MPRNGSGVYSLPGGSTVTNGDTSDATDVNTPLADLVTDANTARPIVAGGTGATSASAVLVNLGVTATAAELNILDGVTSTTAELNILDGVTATTTELNYVDGVTSAIQTQLDAKADDNELTQLEVEDDTSTVFGQVSGQRLGQAIQTSREQGAVTVATTSGTAFDFTSIPAEVQEIEVLFDGVSLDANVNYLIQLGTSGGFVTSGYTSRTVSTTGSGGSTASSTSGMVLRYGASAENTDGAARLRRLEAGSNVWVFDALTSRGSNEISMSTGAIDLGAELTQVRLTRTSTGSFDAGQANVRWK